MRVAYRGQQCYSAYLCIRWKRLQQANCLDNQRCNVGRWLKMLPQGGWTFQSWNWDHSNHSFWLQLWGGQEHVAWNAWNEWTTSYGDCRDLFYSIYIVFHAVPHWFFRHFLLYSVHQDLFKLGQDIAMPADHWRFGWDDASVEISPADSMFWGEFLMAMFQPQKVTIPVPHDPILDGLKPPIGRGWYPSSQQNFSASSQPCARRSWMRAPAKLSSSGNMWWTWEDEPLQHTLAISRYMYLYIC